MMPDCVIFSCERKIDMSRLEEIVRRLPPDVQREVEEFAEYLSSKYSPRIVPKLSQDWAGGLRELRDRYTSLELQKKALEWWGD